MKILMVAPTPFFADRGCHVRILGEVRALEKQGHEVLLCTYPLGRDVDGLQIKRTWSVPWYKKLSAGPSIHKYYIDLLLIGLTAKWIRKWTPDVIHAHLHEGAAVAIVARGFKKIPILLDYQGSLVGETLAHGYTGKKSLQAKILSSIERWTEKKAAGIVTSASSHTVHLNKAYQGDEAFQNKTIKTVGDAVDTSEFDIAKVEGSMRDQLKISKDVPLIAYVGLLTEYQGVDLLLESLAILKKKEVKFHALLMGYPNEELYAQKAKALELAGQVTFTGRMSYQDLPAYLAAADLAVSPKLPGSEGNGKLCNYLAMGLPSVVFDTPVNRELLGDCGFFVEKVDAKAYAEKLEEVLSDESKLVALREPSRVRAIKNFSWQAIASSLEDSYIDMGVSKTRQIRSSVKVPVAGDFNLKNFPSDFKHKKVLVTGATGFTGSLLARKLCLAGANVTAIARVESDVSSFDDLNIKWIRGNIFEESVVRQAVENTEYVFHLATAFRHTEMSDEDYENVDLKGTQLLAGLASKQTSLKRFIHVSTCGVHGHIKNPPATEDSEFSPGDIYQRTKVKAEVWIKDFFEKEGVDYSVIRPVAIYGPGDKRLLKLFRLAGKRFFPVFKSEEEAWYHMIHVEDLTDFMLTCATHEGAKNEVFLCGNSQPMLLKDIVRTIAEILGKKVSFFYLPAGPVFAVARMVESIFKALGAKPPLHPRRIAFFTKDRSFNTDKMTRLTGFKPRYSYDQGLYETAKWYVEHDWIKTRNFKSRENINSNVEKVQVFDESNKISAVIPAFNAEKFIEKCILSLQDSSRKVDEIIIVDDGSEDRTVELATALGARVIKHEINRGASAARNTGVTCASYDLIYMMDVDCVVEKDAIELLYTRLENDTTLAAVSGTSVIPEGQHSLAQLVYDVAERARDFDSKGSEKPYVNCANTLIRRKAFRAAGLFNPDWISHQDFDMTYRFTKAGYKNFFEPRAKSTHYNERTTLKRYYDHVLIGGHCGMIFRLKYKPEIPFSRYLVSHWVLFTLLSPIYFLLFTTKIYKDNFGVRKLSELVKSFPFLVYGQMIYTYGCITGAYAFQKMKKSGALHAEPAYPKQEVSVV